MAGIEEQQAHYKRDYQGMVRELLATHPLDEAMSLAVGGDYEKCGRIQESLLQMFDVDQTSSIIDLGCGSGRLASQLSRHYRGSYLGIDVVKELLDYADSKTSPNFRFAEVDKINIPAPNASADLVTAFSLFTHLLHEETFLYLEETRRVLKPGGVLIFSFLEYGGAGHVEVFKGSLEQYRSGQAKHLNVFIEQQAIGLWAQMLGLTLCQIINGRDAVFPIDDLVTCWGGHVKTNFCAVGQSLAVLQKPLILS